MSHHEHHDHDHTEPPSELELRVKALESLLVDKGLVDSAAVDALVDVYETQVGPHNGAQVVARAWSDPAFKAWLLEDATAAIASMGFGGRQSEHLRGGGELCGGPQPGRVHPVLVLPLGPPGPAARLVQVGALPLAGRCRPARRT